MRCHCPPAPPHGCCSPTHARPPVARLPSPTPLPGGTSPGVLVNVPGAAPPPELPARPLACVFRLVEVVIAMLPARAQCVQSPPAWPVSPRLFACAGPTPVARLALPAVTALTAAL